MISLLQYFGPWFDNEDANQERKDNATVLLGRVNDLLDSSQEDGVEERINAATGSQVSGQTYGGFRPQSCPIGAHTSSHKTGEGIDVYDPENSLDNYLTDAILEAYNLYREHPSATNHWCHITTRAPRSGRRTFFP